MGIKIAVVHIGNAIERRMNELKITQQELAEKMNTQQPNIARLLKKTSLDTQKLSSICMYLDYNFFKDFVPEDEIIKSEQEAGGQVSQSSLAELKKWVEQLIEEKTKLKQENEALKEKLLQYEISQKKAVG